MKCLLAALLSGFALSALAAPSELPEPSAAKLPRWRGFNLLEMFNVGNKAAFKEEDFKLIAELGFNFVRLPLDYRCWIKDKDWRQIDEQALKAVDEAVAFGRKHGIHVCLNFHRAPGYTVAKPPEARSLWTDPEALEVCCQHWAHFAKRFKGIPSRNLSFNLFNEPAEINADEHERVVRAVVAAIRREDPDRLIIADGRQWGRIPNLELADLGIAQATRGYEPGQLTHFKASWVHNDGSVVPTWPMASAHSPLFGPGKKPWNVPLVIAGPVPAGTLRLKIHEVSSDSKLVVKADGTTIWERVFSSEKPDADRASQRKETWTFGVYDRDYAIPLTAPAQRLELSIPSGDWISLSTLGIKAPNGPECVLSFRQEFGKTNPVIAFAGVTASAPFVAPDMRDRARLQRELVAPWQALEQKGVGVMVGEWGAYNKTPHDVTLRWMEDCLKNWQEAGWGWALWNFRGSFGVLDSGRTDVPYETWNGHQLDRKMLELLKRY